MNKELEHVLQGLQHILQRLQHVLWRLPRGLRGLERDHRLQEHGIWGQNHATMPDFLSPPEAQLIHFLHLAELTHDSAVRSQG